MTHVALIQVVERTHAAIHLLKRRQVVIENFASLLSARDISLFDFLLPKSSLFVISGQ
jgi:hypothetical protein